MDGQFNSYEHAMPAPKYLYYANKQFGLLLKFNILDSQIA